MRTFETGATRDSDAAKPDYEGFLSPLVIEAFGRYMHKHRQQPDGNLRDSDNWQKGIPKTAYMKSLWRHFFDLWKLHRGLKVEGVTVEEACTAILFNVQGYLHETLKPEPRLKPADPSGDEQMARFRQLVQEMEKGQRETPVRAGKSGCFKC